jgi:transposase-like protein
MIGKKLKKEFTRLRLNLKIRDTSVLWRAVDSEGLELEVFLQKHRSKKAAIRFLSKLLKGYPVPRVIVTDKLKSYNKPIKYMCPNTEHRSHKGLNNREYRQVNFFTRISVFPSIFRYKESVMWPSK